MIKLIGVCAVFLSARIFYENFAEKDGVGIKKIEDIILFAKLLYVNVMELKMPLEVGAEALKFKISPFIDEFLEEFSISCKEKKDLSVREAFLKAFSKINADKKVKREMSQFFRVIGTADKETVQSYKNTASQHCEEQLSELKKASAGKRKAAGAAAFAASAVTVIMLL